jgi:PII-like signaling protein
VKIDHNGTLMRIYLSESARSGGRDALTALVEAIAAAGIAGATAFKGIEGYGSSRVISSERVVDAWMDLPLLIEVVDDDEKIRAFLPTLERVLFDGLVTLERVQTLFRRTADRSAP